MVGILCEKPSQGRNFAKALGGATGKYNGEDYLIVAARGHLYEFVDPHLQVPSNLSDYYHSWVLTNLPWDEKVFSWKYVEKGDTPKDVKDTKDLLKDLAAKLGKCDEIAIGTDFDPSGEGMLLGAEILINMNLDHKKLSRMHFIDESAKEIQTAFVNRKPVPVLTANEEYTMAYLRSRWDFLSQQFTRIATKCGDGHSVLREGRLKSAMQRLVGDQLKLVASYQKIPYYQNRFRDENGVMYTNPEEPSYKTKDEVPQQYHDSDVVVDSKTMKRTVPPKLLDLAALSSRLAPKGYKAKAVQDVYQKMYEAEVVSYPRTEDKTITPEQFNDLLPFVDQIANVVGVNPALLTHRTPRPTHVKKGGAHGANRPGLKVPKDLASLAQYDVKGATGLAAAIYELLGKNYLATLAEDYEYEAQKGHVKDYPKFVGSASVPKVAGWKAVFNDDADPDEDDNDKGLGTLAKPFVFEGFPPKPATPTMKWLMSQLEKYDIGTGATRNSTYADVTNEKTKYPLLKDTKGKITMTQFGEMSYYLLKDTNIGSLEVTKQLLIDMKGVSDGTKDPDTILADIKRMVVEDIATMKLNSVEMRKELGMAQGSSDAEKYEGTWNGKTVKFKKAWSTHTFTDEECEKLCNGEEIEIEMTSKEGKPYKIHGVLAEQDFEKDGKKIKYVGFKNLGFVNTGSSSASGVPAKWAEHVFTEDEKTILESGCIIEGDFISKKKTKFHCQIRFGQKSDGTMGIIPEFDKDFNNR